MTTRIRKVAVLGAGVMGSGIAAHLANAGIPALLLDIVPPKAGARRGHGLQGVPQQVRRSGRWRTCASRSPARIVSRSGAHRSSRSATSRTTWPRIAECDWVVEVVKEDLAVKQALFAKVEPHAASRTPSSAPTPRACPSRACSRAAAPTSSKRFLVTHFFNPVRYMKLLELVAGEETDPEVLKRIAPLRRGGARQGHRLRQGHHQLHRQPHRHLRDDARPSREMQKAELTVEEVDKIFGPAHGPPEVRRVPHRGHRRPGHLRRTWRKNCYDTLAQRRGARDLQAVPDFLEKMVEKGMLGDKTGGGFYKKDEGRGRQGDPRARPEDARVPAAGEGALRVAGRRQGRRGRRASASRTVMNGTGQGGASSPSGSRWTRWPTRAGASRRSPTTSSTSTARMRWGFAWELGPFETWDAYRREEGRGADEGAGPQAAPPWVEQMLAAGRDALLRRGGRHGHLLGHPAASGRRAVPENAAHARASSTSSAATRRSPRNDSATLWDMGDGVALLEFHSKMNSIDDRHHRDDGHGARRGGEGLPRRW